MSVRRNIGSLLPKDIVNSLMSGRPVLSARARVANSSRERKKVCRRGLHAMSDDNIYIHNKSGRRHCRQCRKLNRPKPLMSKEEREEFWRQYREEKKTDKQEKEQLRLRNLPEGKDRYILRYKQTHSCHDCPESDPVCLDFHHRDPKNKSFEVAKNEGKSLDEVKIEIEKCDVVCANCHRKRHKKEGYPTNGRPKTRRI